MEVRWLLLSVSYAHLSRHTPPPEFTEWNAESVASVKQFGALASKMAVCLHRMPPGAWMALFQRGPALGHAVLGLEKGFYEKLAKGAERAGSRALKKPKGGRPIKWTHHVAGDVARRTARAYELLTGKRATPGGNRVSDERNEFERLLQKVYANLGIEASAEVHARKLVREKTKPK